MKILIYSSDSNLVKKLKLQLQAITGVDSKAIQIEKFEPEKQIPKTFDKADIVFLDFTQVSDPGEYLSSSKLKVDKNTVILSSYYRGGKEAFQRGALDFVLEPVNKERLKITIQKFQKRNLDVDSLSLLDSGTKKEQEIPISKILYLEAENKYCHIYLQGGKKITVAQTLKGIGANLPINFLRVHKTYLVRSDVIKDFYYIPGGSYRVALKNSQELPVGRQYYKFVKSTLLSAKE